VTPVHAMRVAGDDGKARLDFDAYGAGVPALAWTVEDRLLHEALWRALEGLGRCEVVAPAQGDSLVTAAGRATLRLRDGRSLTAAIVVAADGASSFVRQQAGIAASSREYGQVALVANFECAKAHGNVARQWFQGGPVLALLPLPGRQVSMIWSLPAEDAARLGSMDAEAFCRAVAEAAGGVLGRLSPLTPPRSYPLRRLSAARMIAPRVALVGDAAHVVHPLAGQGLNLGLQDVRDLAALLGSPRGRRDAGDPGLLRAYERKRAEPILAMDLMVDGLFRLFAAQGKAVGAVRNGGLNLTDRLAVLKNLLIRQAMA